MLALVRNLVAGQIEASVACLWSVRVWYRCGMVWYGTAMGNGGGGGGVSLPASWWRIDGTPTTSSWPVPLLTGMELLLIS